MERRENATKQRIRDTATRLFRENSFESVTLNDICEASGVNRHTFYYYFKSKDELLERYYDLPWGLSATDAANILTADSYVEQLWLIMKKFVDHLEQSGVTIVRQILIKNLNQDMGTFRPGHGMRELARLQVNIIQKGQEAGQFHNQADSLALVVLLQQIVHSTGLIWVVMNGNFDFERRVRFLFESLLNVDDAYRTTQDYQVQMYKEMKNPQVHEGDQPEEPQTPS